MNHFIVCTETEQKLKEFMYIVWFCTIKSMIIVRKYTYVKRGRERAKTTSKYSHMYANMPVERRLDSPRMPWLAPTSIRQATGSIHIEEASRVQHNVQTCYWNSLSWDFAECASWNFFSSQLMLWYALSVCNIKCVFYVRGLACVRSFYFSFGFYLLDWFLVCSFRQ